LTPSPETLLAAACIVTLAYIVFGLTGFGSSITAMPFLVQWMPLKVAVPVMLLLDMCTGLLLLRRNGRHAQLSEVLPLLPFMMLGCVLGLSLLVQAPERALLLGLGAFVLAYAAWSLILRPAVRPMGRGWSLPFGTAGGVFTALFGTGGPIYAIYLTRRIEDKHCLRATLASVVLISAFVRLALFAWAGILWQAAVGTTAALALPFALTGLWIGSHLHARLPAKHVVRGTWTVLICGALGLVWRNL
jgi:uncharacterized membrane protein YfcA